MVNHRLSFIIYQPGFTLIELLIVIVIIGILAALSGIGLAGARQSARDSRRKADLENIRSGLEIYKADCNDYPAALPAVGSDLVGDGTPTTCALANTYISSVQGDPNNPSRIYLYNRISLTQYEICAALEQGSGSVTCGGSSSCGTGVTCNFRVINP